MKALAHLEEAPRYWHDALGIIAASELDWDYLVRRARAAASAQPPGVRPVGGSHRSRFRDPRHLHGYVRVVRGYRRLEGSTSTREHEMALDEYLESEVAIAVAVTAAALSPRARRVLRRGAVYGVAGALKAADVVTAAARGVTEGMSAQAEAGGPGDGRAKASKQAPRTRRA
jgi:hypothetical protein